MKHLFIALTFLFSVLTLSAQLYTVSTPYKSIVKTTNHGIMHEFIQIDNLSGQNLPMRWIGHIGGVLECPPGWDYGVADPDSAYAVLNDNDSADFILSDTNYTNNKIILTAVHNGFIGNCEVNFDIFPLSNPSDKTTIGFTISVSQGPVGVTEYTITRKDFIYPNPGNGLYHIKEPTKEIHVFNTHGQEVLNTSGNQIDLRNFSNGFYMIRTLDQTGRWNSHKVVKN